MVGVYHGPVASGHQLMDPRTVQHIKDAFLQFDRGESDWVRLNWIYQPVRGMLAKEGKPRRAAILADCINVYVHHIMQDNHYQLFAKRLMSAVTIVQATGIAVIGHLLNYGSIGCATGFFLWLFMKTIWNEHTLLTEHYVKQKWQSRLSAPDLRSCFSLLLSYIAILNQKDTSDTVIYNAVLDLLAEHTQFQQISDKLFPVSSGE